MTANTPQPCHNNDLYSHAVPHGFAGFYPSFATAATVLRLARPELDATVCATPQALEEFFDLLDTVELSLPHITTQHALKQPFVVVVEGLDGSGKSTLVKSLAEALGAFACATPSGSLVRPAFDKRGGPVARAFYMVSNFILQHEILMQHNENSIFVVDRWFSSTCAYSLAWKNTTGGAESSIDALSADLFAWPPNLVPPQLQIVLDLDDAIRRQRVQQRGDTPESNRFNPWDDRLSQDVHLGRRILRAHARSVGPAEHVILNASGTKQEILEEAVAIVRDRLQRYQTPWQPFAYKPTQWFVWQSSRLKLCDNGRRLHHAPWAMQLAVKTAPRMPPNLRSVGIHTADDEGILFFTWQGGAMHASNDKKFASAVCLLGSYPREQQWRMEGFLVSSTWQTNQLLDIKPPPSLLTQISACSKSTIGETSLSHRLERPDNFTETVAQVKQQEQKDEKAVVGTRLVPLRMEVLLGGPSSPGGPQRWEWSRGPYRKRDDSSVSSMNGWSRAVSILPFSSPGLTAPSIQIQPVTLVLVGTHCAGKETIGRKVAELLEWIFQPELGNVLRDKAKLAADGHCSGYGFASKDWDDYVLEAEGKRDVESSGMNRVVETWHVGNLAWAHSRDNRKETLRAKTVACMEHAGQNSCCLMVLLQVDSETSVRRRRLDSSNEERLPLTEPLEECQRLHSYLNDQVLGLQFELMPDCPHLVVDNSVDGKDGMLETCSRILQFVQLNQWRRAVNSRT